MNEKTIAEDDANELWKDMRNPLGADFGFSEFTGKVSRHSQEIR